MSRLPLFFIATLLNVISVVINGQTQTNQFHRMFNEHMEKNKKSAAAPGAAGGNPIATAEVPSVSSVTTNNVGRSSHLCTYTSADGWLYDLSPLIKPEGVEDYHVRFEKQQFSLTLNICANVDKKKLPQSCESTFNHGVSSPVYQSNEPGKSCYYLGDVKQPEWYVMDKTKPRKGVVLTYKNGQPCGGRGRRTVSYHMICANNFLSSEPPSFAYESPTCHYHVVWPSIHACPRSATGPRFIHMLLSFVVIYFVFRTAYRKFILNIDGLDAIPHLGIMQSCCYSMLDMLDMIKGKIPGFGGFGGRSSNNNNSNGSGMESENNMEDLQPMKIGITDDL